MRQLYKIKWDMITAYRKITHKNIVLKRYNGKRILPGQEGNDYMWASVKYSLENGGGILQVVLDRMSYTPFLNLN